MRISTLVLCLALCLALARAASDPSLIVQTQYGPVQGATTSTSKVWLGIPFAAPPVGTLRWMPPVPPTPWTDVRDGTHQYPACPQAATVLVPGATTSEDCLFIQVYAPLNSNPSSNLPVFYYIYGGGFRSGSPEKYTGEFMAGDDIIVVVAAYRLGPLGFMGHPLLRDLNSLNTTGNYAIQDQRLGMEWIKNNIRLFGGNPDDVTIGGTSAGGGSVCLHLVSPHSQPYFKKVLMESAASCTGIPTPMTTAYSRADQFFVNLGCTGTDAEKLACAYAATPAQVIAASTSGNPVQDTYELMESPISLVSKGQFKRVPILMGTQANESSVNYCGNPLTTPEQFRTAVQNKYPATAATLLATYNLTNYPNPTAAANAVDSDTSFICPSKSFEDTYSAMFPDIWVYNFDQYPFYATGGGGTRECLGASHTFNLGYTFPSFYISRLPRPLPSPIFTPAEETLAYKWRKTEAQFIKTGNPQVPEIGRLWPRYTFQEGNFLNVDIGDWWVGTHFKNDYCPAWGIPSSDTSCEKSISFEQTHVTSWTDGNGDAYNQYTVNVVTGDKPVYAADLIIRFNIVPFTSGPFDSLVEYWGITRNQVGRYEINDWHFAAGLPVPPHSSLSFGYTAKSDGPAVISVGLASCVPPPKNCDVSAALNLRTSWSDGSRFFQLYDFAFTNQGADSTNTVTVALSLPAGSYPSQAWNLQTSQSQADILASGSVTFTGPVWGLETGETTTDLGFVLSSPVANAPAPSFSVSGTTCL